MKKLISVLLSFLFAFLIALSAAADQDFPDAELSPELQLQVRLFGSQSAFTTVHELPGYEDAPFYLFLPAGCNRKELIVFFDAPEMTVNGKTLTSGQKTDVFQNDGTCTVETDGKTYSLQVIGSENLPSVYITTESGSLEAVHADKSHKEPASFSLAENGELTVESAPLTYIKGRGNTSWRANSKRSYNLNFEEKTSLLGMEPAKKWVLTSNNTDPTLMRNAIAYTLAQYSDLPYTVDFRFVDLYIDGSYRGNYMICEKIEIGPTRLDLTDPDDLNRQADPDFDRTAAAPVLTETDGCRMKSYSYANEPAADSCGYLLEFEYPEAFDEEPSAFITKNGQCLILHAPKYATTGEISYIAGLYSAFEEALFSPDGKNSKGKHYSEYIDLDSFVDGVLLFEYAQNRDLGHTSWYLYLPANGTRFYMGPIWDFDSGMDDPAAFSCTLFAAQSEYYGMGKTEEVSFITLLCSHSDFLQKLAQRFPALADAFDGEPASRIDSLFAEIQKSAYANNVRWGASSTADVETERLKTFAYERTSQLRGLFSNLAQQLDSAREQVRTRDEQTKQTQIEEAARKIIPAAAIICCILAAAALIVFTRKNRAKKQK